MAHPSFTTSRSSLPSMLDREHNSMTDEAWDTGSDSILDDFQRPSCCFGVPLTRMIKLESLSSSSSQSSDADDPEDPDEAGYFVRDEEINLIEEDMSLFNLALTQRDGSGDLSLSSTSHAYVHHVIDDMTSHTRGSSSPRLFMHATPSHPSHPLLVRHLPSTITYARELALWRYLNDDSLRRDPWNPSPPVLSIIERELPSPAVDRHLQTDRTEIGPDDTKDEAYIVMDRLYHLHDNPLKSTGDWIDFIRQMLQGLVFIHEHNIAHVSYPHVDEALTSSVMMDIGLAPRQTHFSRAEFPVKYYLLNFSTAVRVRLNATAQPSYPLHFSGLRGRSRNTVLLSASRFRASAIPSDPLIGSLIDRTSSMNHALILADARSCSDSDISLISSRCDTQDLSTLALDTPTQSHFIPPPSSPDRFSDPKLESCSEEGSSDEEQQHVWEVSPTTRALLFAGDIKSLSRVLEDAVQLARPVSEALVPVFTAMRQAKALCLSAKDVLRLFENAVRPLDVASVVT